MDKHDAEILKVFTSILISESTYHLGVIISFFLIIHCTLRLNQSTKVYIY